MFSKNEKSIEYSFQLLRSFLLKSTKVIAFHTVRYDVQHDLLNAPFDRRKSKIFFSNGENKKRMIDIYKQIFASFPQGYSLNTEIYKASDKKSSFFFSNAKTWNEDIQEVEISKLRELFPKDTSTDLNLLKPNSPQTDDTFEELSVEDFFEQDVNLSIIKSNVDLASFPKEPFKILQCVFPKNGTNNDLYFYYLISPIAAIEEKQISDASINLFCKEPFTQHEFDLLFSLFTEWSAAVSLQTFLNYGHTQSCKAAIGSIMSRNGSHNIGSHVLAALTHNVGTMPDDRVLYQYLQQRMDYIATVTTDFPSWGSSTMFVSDMMKTFFCQRHLLEYISGSEGLHAYHFQDHNIDDVERRKQTDKIKIFIRRIQENIRTAEENPGKKIGMDAKWELLNTSTKDHALHFIRYSDKVGIHFKKMDNVEFIDYKEDSLLPLEHDVTLAIPGGVIGEHAFFTILENIIRNAAKHGWAAYSRQSDNADNLEIYIDFLDNPTSDFIEFTIWDNMSDVLKTYKATDDTSRERIARLTNGADVHLPLDMEKNCAKIESLQKACNPKAAANDKIDIKDLPLHWQQQLLLNQPLITPQGELRRRNWGLAEMRISAGYLQHRTVGEIGGLEELQPKDGEENYIILPVAVPGVCAYPDNKNGGIRCNICTHPSRSDCPIQKDLYHLGYRFKVPKPKEMLIVLTSDIRIDGAAFKKKGVYFAKEKNKQYYLINDDGNINENKSIPNFNFDYIVFPNEEVAEKCGEALLSKGSKEQLTDNNKAILNEEQKKTLCKSLFPLRLLTSNNDYKSVFAKLQDAVEKTGEEDIQAVKNEVYRLWLEKLKCERTDLEERLKEEPKLKIQLQTESPCSSGGSGLITTRDLLDFVFRNNFHSVITNLKPDFKNYPDCLMVLDLLSVYPEPYHEFPRDVFSDIYSAIADSLATMCDKLERFWPSILELEYNRHIGGQVNDGKQYPSFVVNYHSRILKDASEYLNRSATEIRTAVSFFAASGKLFSDDELLALIQDDAVNETESSPFSSLVDATGLPRLAQALYAAYQTADTLLRKNEEHIVTLPKGYLTDKLTVATRNIDKLKKRNNTLNAIGITVTDNKGLIEKFTRPFTHEPIIKYCRHDNTLAKSTIYAEALSGSQSYLNTLHRALYEPDDFAPGLFVRLAENALIRLLIIDERVSDFLKKHSDSKQTFEAMYIDVADITPKVPDAVKTTENKIYLDSLQLLPPEQQSRKEKQKTGKRWDMLIIHQGIIDKWFPREHQNKKTVGELIRNLQKQINSERVVVTTGRGRPDNIPDWVKILPFSMLESTLFRKYPEKLLLVGAVINVLPTFDKNCS